MNPTLHVPETSTTFVCEHCDQIIHENEVVHLRENCALPEESTYHVHSWCADAFTEAHSGCWETIASDSVDAGWLLY